MNVYSVIESLFPDDTGIKLTVIPKETVQPTIHPEHEWMYEWNEHYQEYMDYDYWYGKEQYQDWQGEDNYYICKSKWIRLYKRDRLLVTKYKDAPLEVIEAFKEGYRLGEDEHGTD